MGESRRYDRWGKYTGKTRYVRDHKSPRGWAAVRDIRNSIIWIVVIYFAGLMMGFW